MKMLFGVLLGAFALGIMISGALFYLGQKSQNGVAPGLQDGVLAQCPSAPNCVVSEAHGDEKHRVAPFPVDAWGGVAAAVADTGGKIVQQSDDYIAAEYRSKTFGFVDDVEFRKGADGVHVRSASRVGYSDRGVNKARVDALRAALAAG